MPFSPLTYRLQQLVQKRIIRFLLHNHHLLQRENVIGIWRDDYDTKILHRIRKDKNKGYIMELSHADEPGKWVDYTSLREQYLNGFRVFFDKEPY